MVFADSEKREKTNHTKNTKFVIIYNTKYYIVQKPGKSPI